MPHSWAQLHPLLSAAAQRVEQSPLKNDMIQSYAQRNLRKCAKWPLRLNLMTAQIKIVQLAHKRKRAPPEKPFPSSHKSSLVPTVHLNVKSCINKPRVCPPCLSDSHLCPITPHTAYHTISQEARSIPTTQPQYS